MGMIVFPFAFVSSAYVPVSSMPSWLQVFAKHQPLTYMVDAVRSLTLGPHAAGAARPLELVLRDPLAAVDGRDHRGVAAARRRQVPARLIGRGEVAGRLRPATSLAASPMRPVRADGTVTTTLLLVRLSGEATDARTHCDAPRHALVHRPSPPGRRGLGGDRDPHHRRWRDRSVTGTPPNFTLPGTESQRASDLLTKEFGAQSGDADTIVFHVSHGTVDSPRGARRDHAAAGPGAHASARLEGDQPVRGRRRGPGLARSDDGIRHDRLRQGRQPAPERRRQAAARRRSTPCTCRVCRSPPAVR